jgi:hypothetical protein
MHAFCLISGKYLLETYICRSFRDEEEELGRETIRKVDFKKKKVKAYEL